MPITPLPTAPSRARPATFSSEADALLGALPTFVEELNAAALGESAAGLALTLADSAGSGVVGYSSGSTYPAGTSGLAIQAAAASAATALANAAAATASAAAVAAALSSRVRAVPTGFSWAGIVPTICLAPGAAQASEGVMAYARRVHSALLGSGVTWVDPVNGLDTNTGTISAPVKTLGYACRTLAPSQIYCVPGVYEPFEFRNTDAQGAKLKILTALGPCVIRNAADDPTTATWTADGTFPNVYWMPLTPANKAVLAVLDTGRLDADGQPLPLRKGASVSAANSAGEGWYHDDAADRLYVRFMGAANVNNAAIKGRLRIITGDATTKVMVYGAKLAFEGDWRLEGAYLQPLVNGAVQPSLFMECHESTTPTVSYCLSHGMDALGSISYLQGVWMHRNQGDNFHYTDSGGLGCSAVEINCKGTQAGDFETTQTAAATNNGSSIHLAGNIVRINGQYLRNYGPDVVDTGTGKSWNVGTVAGPARPSGNAFGLYTTGPEMFLDTCSSRDQPQGDIAATAGGVLKLFATSYRTSSTAGGGSIVSYTP